MAGDWIKMRADLFTHPKVVRISSALKVDRLRTVGGLMSVWCLFGVHSVDGFLEGYTSATLDELVGWPGFSDAMAAVGWLDIEEEDGLSLPEFDTHNGQSAKRRAQDAGWKKAVRKVSASQVDKMPTREEKRREDIEGKPSMRGSRLSKDFEPAPEPEAESGIDRALELTKFHDFWAAKSGKDATKLDWQATWRNWARNAKRPGFTPPQPLATVTDPAAGARAFEATQRRLAADAALPRTGLTPEVRQQLARAAGGVAA